MTFKSLSVVVALIFFVCAAAKADEKKKLSGCHQAAGLKEEVCSVSMVALIANPDKYDGRLISVTGVFADGKYPILFVNTESYMHSVVTDGVVLERPKSDDLVKIFSLNDRSSMTVYGRFSSEGVYVDDFGAKLTAGKIFDIFRAGGSGMPWGYVATFPSMAKDPKELQGKEEKMPRNPDGR